MILQVWRLSENSGDDNLGLACTEQGLVLGRTPLIERRDGRFVVRERNELEHLLSRAYRTKLNIDRLMPGLATVAAALNANDQALARIAAVHLRVPDLPDQAARDEIESADALIKYAGNQGGGSVWNSALHPRDIFKASPDDPKHPGWPAGTEGGRGGQFRPKDGSDVVIAQDIKERIRRIEARQALRTEALAVLRLAAELAVDAVPGIGLAADAATLIDMANTIAELKKLKIDADAAIEFVRYGPYSLEELQVSSNYEEFSSYGDFIKDAAHIALIVKRFGRAGSGNQYHHIVTQGGANTKIPPEQLQNTDNVIPLPTLLHEAVNGEYSRHRQGTNMTEYQWLQTQPYDVQREEGLEISAEIAYLEVGNPGTWTSRRLPWKLMTPSFNWEQNWTRGWIIISRRFHQWTVSHSLRRCSPESK